MAAETYVDLSGGDLTQKRATAVSTGVAEANDIVALDAGGKLDNSVMPVGIGADTSTVQASEALAAGDWVNIWNSAGTFRVRKADAAGGVAKRAHGFVTASVSSSANATIYHEGTNNGVSGMTAGDVYLTATPGVGSATPASGSGSIVQKLGVATAAGAVNADIDSPIILA